MAYLYVRVFLNFLFDSLCISSRSLVRISQQRHSSSNAAYHPPNFGFFTAIAATRFFSSQQTSCPVAIDSRMISA
jgi:hypothetical protein